LNSKQIIKRLRQAAGLALPPVLRLQGMHLLDQQLWCLGRDVMAEGNLLMQAGFSRNPPPAELGARSSFYQHGPLTVWGWGMLWTIPHWGSLFIKRYDFKPLYLLGAAPLIWRMDDLPPCAPPPCEATALHALADLARFWATYERWLAEHSLAAYRASVIAANPNKQTRPIPADDFASRWDALADAWVRLIPTVAQPKLEA
jgi:hypothetical protein